METRKTGQSRVFLQGLLALVAMGVLLVATAPAEAAPIGIRFEGLLADGGSFSGSMFYGDEDVDDPMGPEPDGRGRYTGGLWDFTITGGSSSTGATLSATLGGRAPVETASSPFTAIAFFILGPELGELPRLELIFEALPGYDPDVQPLLSDIGNLTAFSNYRDAIGNQVAVTSVTISAVPLPGALGLAACALASLGLFGRRQRRTA